MGRASSALSLRVIVALVAAAIVVAFGLAGAVIVDVSRDRMAEDGRRTIATYAQLVALAHDQWIAESRPLLSSLSVIDRDDLVSGACTRKLAEVLKNAHGYDTLLIAAPDGRVLCAPWKLSKPVSVADREYFTKALATKDYASGEYVVGRVSGLRVLPVALPVLGPDGQVDRVMIAGKQLDWFRRMIDSLGLPAGLHVGLLDRNAVELTTYREMEMPIEDRSAVGEDLARAVAEGHTLFREVQGSDGVVRMVALAPLGGGGMPHGIVVSRPIREAQAEESRFLWTTIGVLGAALVAVAVAVLLLLQRFVVAPVGRLIDGMRGVRAGDRAWRAGDRAGGAMEIKELYRSLDGMLAELARHEQRVKAQAADLARSNADLQNFAYTVSHDLREPLRTISSFIKLIERRYAGQLDDEGREFMAFVTDGAARMTRMLDGVLEYSRINTRGNEPAPVPLDAPLDQAIQSLTVAMEESGARVVRAVPLPVVMGDADQLSRLFQNLLANSVKFARPGQPPEITVSARDAGDGLWEIAVADNGVGLPADGRDALFQLFRRLVTRDQVPGDGVGLALCKRIVERHGGTIRVDSEEGRGATFLFTLPAA
ncbi:MAG: ATP-binding protein [Pseudomonadota bacterium]